MRLMRINALLILTPQTYTSRPACSFFRTAKDQLALLTRATRRCLRMFTLKLTSLPLSMVLLLLSGVLSPRSLLQDLRRPLWELVVGIVLWLKSGIQLYRLSHLTPMSSARVSAHQPSTPLSVL